MWLQYTEQKISGFYNENVVKLLADTKLRKELLWQMDFITDLQFRGSGEVG